MCDAFSKATTATTNKCVVVPFFFFCFLNVVDGSAGYVFETEYPFHPHLNELWQAVRSWVVSPLETQVEFGHIRDWNTSLITSMESIFEGIEIDSNNASFLLDVADWDVSSVTFMPYLCRNSRNLVIDMSRWDTSKVYYMREAFAYAVNLTVDVSQWNTSSTTDMGALFQGSYNLSADVAAWNVQNVTNMGDMFSRASHLHANVSQWNTSSVTAMPGLFRGCSNTLQVDVSRWNTQRVEYMMGLFSDTSNLTVNVSNWNTSSITTLQDMFSYSRDLTVDVSLWDVSKATSTFLMFAGATRLDAVDVSRWDTSKVNSMGNMFWKAFDLTMNLSAWDTANVRSMDSTFMNAYNVTTDSLANWDTSNVRTMVTMFTNSSLLSVGDIFGWNTSQTINMGGIFYNSSTWMNQTLCWDLDQVVLGYEQSGNFFCNSAGALDCDCMPSPLSSFQFNAYNLHCDWTLPICRNASDAAPPLNVIDECNPPPLGMGGACVDRHDETVAPAGHDGVSESPSTISGDHNTHEPSRSSDGGSSFKLRWWYAFVAPYVAAWLF